MVRGLVLQISPLDVTGKIYRNGYHLEANRHQWLMVSCSIHLSSIFFSVYFHFSSHNLRFSLHEKCCYIPTTHCANNARSWPSRLLHFLLLVMQTCVCLYLKQCSECHQSLDPSEVLLSFGYSTGQQVGRLPTIHLCWSTVIDQRALYHSQSKMVVHQFWGWKGVMGYIENVLGLRYEYKSNMRRSLSSCFSFVMPCPAKPPCLSW